MIKLHLGCGKIDLGKDYISIDSGCYPHVTSHDVTRLPFSDSSVELIYASHLLSYFDREEGFSVIREWFRVLVQGGRLMLAVPDFEAMCELYFRGRFPIEDFLGPLYGKLNGSTTDTRCGILTHPSIYHKTVYDLRSVSKLLHKCGFIKVEKCDGTFYDNDQSNARLPDRNPSGALISLNVTATK